jgi:chromosome segregation ATPase
MKTKKKLDLTSELADLLMADEGSTEFGATRALTKDTRALTPTSVNENDNDPTVEVRKSTHSVAAAPVSEVDKETEPTQKSKTSKSDKAEAAENTQKKEVTEKKNQTQFGGFSQIFDEKKEPQNTAAKRSSGRGDILLTSEGALIQSEQLRVAQERILELERIVDSLRIENEELLSAGETLRNKTDTLQSQLDNLAESQKDKREALREELVVAKTALTAKTEELARKTLKVEELETRLSSDLKRIRVRERELENRLEILKLENQAILKNKDEVILDLKRKIDQFTFELESYRSKGRDLNRQVEENRERVRRTVKALRLALTMLEGEEEEGTPLKKAE